MLEDLGGGLATPKPFSKGFFDLYLTEVPYGVEYDLDEEPVLITLLRRPGHGLRLSVSLAIDSASLELLHPALTEPPEIAYADHAHPIPDVLRVEEVEAFCHGVSVNLGAFESPNLEMFPEREEVSRQRAEAIARVLLSPFTICTPANEGRQRTAMEQSLHVLGFTEEEIESLRERSFFPIFASQEEASWERKADKWYVVGEYAHSRRDGRRSDFPHRELSEVIGELSD